YLYFVPVFVVTVFLLARNYRRVTGAQSTAIRAIMLALLLRWVSGHVTYNIAPPLGQDVFDAALSFDPTAAVLAGMIVISYAVRAGQLFRVRGCVAEILLYAAFALTVAAVTFAGIGALLAWVKDPTALRLGLFAVSLVPLGLTALGLRMHARVE